MAVSPNMSSVYVKDRLTQLGGQLFFVHAIGSTRGNNSNNNQCELEKSFVCNHFTTSFQRWTDPPSGNPLTNYNKIIYHLQWREFYDTLFLLR